MGIRDGGAKQFSGDILRICVTGRDEPSFTLVDLPGILHSTTADQDEKGRKIVNQLIEWYMKQSKSIILAIVPANNQLAVHQVLEKAMRHDPKRERTIGVITKPDMAGRGSANEKKYLNLANGREPMHKLALGWYVLRNSSEEERSLETTERDTVEDSFFQSGNWVSLNPANRGIGSLRRGLSKVLLDYIRKGLPDVIIKVEDKLRDRKRELNRLGNFRTTRDELRSYLLGVADDFQRLARDAIEGRYGDKFFGALDQESARLKKLRAVLRNMNWAFETAMETKRSRYKIVWKVDDDGGNDGGNDRVNSDLGNKGTIPDFLKQLVDGYDAPDPEPKYVWELSDELDAQFTQGKEFPCELNPELVSLLFKKQVAPWKTLSQQHLDRVLAVARTFVETVFAHIIGPDEATLKAMLNIHVDKFFIEKESELLEKLQELLLPYIEGYGLPHEGEFHGRMSGKTFQMVGSQSATHLEKKHPGVLEERPNHGLGPRDIARANHNPGRSESNLNQLGTEKVIDMMTIHYEASDCRQATDFSVPY